MLRKLYINHKKIPVPVPLRSIADAIHWIESTLLPSGHTITRIAINEKLVNLESVKSASTLISDESRLDIQIDSPLDLATQTLEALRNLGLVVASGLKMLAYECWKAKPPFRAGDIDALLADINLMLELIEHCIGLSDSMYLDSSAIGGIALLIKRSSTALALARSNGDLKGFAKILLNQFEPVLKDLISEAESLHLRLLMKPQSKAASTGT